MRNNRMALMGAIGTGIGILILLMYNSNNQPVAQNNQPQIIVQDKTDYVEILTAKEKMNVGDQLSPANLQWKKWPKEAVDAEFVRRDFAPNAMNDYVGAIARSGFVPGEPIKSARIVKSDAGVLSAILEPGMRGVSLVISPETGAGGFILPNDRVDVILSRSTNGRSGSNFISETILMNIKVLAIDQILEEQNGQAVVIGRTATVELTPKQSEKLAMSRNMGQLSLALRSLSDAKSDVEEDSQSTVTFVKYGNKTKILAQ